MGSVYGTNGEGMAFAAPIRNEHGQPIGVWYNYASWQEVTDAIRIEAEQDLIKNHPGSLAIITKNNGEVISTGSKSLIGKSIKADETGVIHATPDSLSSRVYGVGRSKGAYTYAGKKWNAFVFIPEQHLSWGVFFSKKNTIAIIVCLGVITAVLAYTRSFFRKKIISRVEQIGDLQRRLSEGELVQASSSEASKNIDEFEAMMQSLSLLASSLKTKAVFADEISQGNLGADLKDLNQNDVLGKSLLNMRNQLRVAQETDSQRNWTSEGLARIGELLRSFKSTEELYITVIQFIVKYVNSNQGGLFLLDENREKIRLVSCYAYQKKKFLDKEFEAGSGIIGQCILEGSTLYLTDVPKDYVHITSGLGDANPRSLLIVPLKSNEEVYGAIEMASFSLFKDHEISFIEKACEGIASSISMVHGTEKTKALVEQLSQQTEELKSQEEEMRQNMEEMQATQEEMGRKSNELAKTSEEMQGLLGGINATMATIEFTPQGEVITANENFLETFKYDLGSIVGVHHRKFVPREILESSDYSAFWKNLAAGKSNKGVFKRIASTGKTVWLNAIYNPILNTNGEVIKVVKFATDITSEQETVAQSKGILEGIDSTMATVEFTPDGYVTDANENFLTAMKYNLKDIKGLHHSKFVPEKIKQSEEYKTFWKNLAAGNASKGTFERVTSKGEAIYLAAIYTPLRNSTGDVIKVMKLATVEKR